MKSKIRVEFDLDKNEPYIQLSIDDTCPPNEQADMRDLMLRHLVQKASQEDGLHIYYSPITLSNDHPQLRIRPSVPEKVFSLTDEEKLEQKYCKINATYLQDYGDGHKPYEIGQAYNLKFANGDDNSILVKDSGYTFSRNGFRKYASLAQFLTYWSVNNTMGH